MTRNQSLEFEGDLGQFPGCSCSGPAGAAALRRPRAEALQPLWPCGSCRSEAAPGGGSSQAEAGFGGPHIRELRGGGFSLHVGRCPVWEVGSGVRSSSLSLFLPKAAWIRGWPHWFGSVARTWWSSRAWAVLSTPTTTRPCAVRASSWPSSRTRGWPSGWAAGSSVSSSSMRSRPSEALRLPDGSACHLSGMCFCHHRETTFKSTYLYRTTVTRHIRPSPHRCVWSRGETQLCPGRRSYWNLFNC